MLQFAASGLVATLLVGLIAVALVRRVGEREAIRDAKQVARLAGEGIVAPSVDEAVLQGNRTAIRRLDGVVRSQVLRDGIVRVKVWARDGRIVYSDEPRLRGARYALGEDERKVLAEGSVDAEVSDLSQPENRFERGYGELLEVYLPIHGPHGDSLLFESYQRQSSVTASGQRLWLAVLPALIGGLVLLQLVNLPLARAMVRRQRAAQAERETLLRRAVDSSELERRRIAADLHDGVVQDLVGVSYELEAQAAEVPGSNGSTRDALQRGAQKARDSVRALRTLLVDIYPPNLHRAGLVAALSDLTRTVEARGVATTVELPPRADLPPDVEALLFRCAQEALRNVLAHAEASQVSIALTVEDGEAHLEVADDGRGFDPAVLDDRPEEGHFGVRLVRDLVRDAGGRLVVESSPGEGTVLRVELPAG